MLLPRGSGAVTVRESATYTNACIYGRTHIQPSLRLFIETLIISPSYYPKRNR
jgi:hypothetical protein